MKTGTIITVQHTDEGSEPAPAIVTGPRNEEDGTYPATAFGLVSGAGNRSASKAIDVHPVNAKAVGYRAL